MPTSGSSHHGRPAVGSPDTSSAGKYATRAGTRQPAEGGTNSSVGPPAVTTTGRPHAIASSTGRPNPSARYGWASASHAA